jgi:hypothetical protein
MKAILGVVGALVLLVAIYFGWTYYRIQQAVSGPAAEIASESITRTADTWHVSFVSRFDAPVDRVFEAFTHPERAHEMAPDNVLKSEIVKEDGNTKLVDVIGKLDILPPGFKVQNLRTEYTVYPDEKRITTRSIDFKLADIQAEYRFEPSPDGKTTILRFSQTSKDKAPMIVESLQKGALRETYLTQVRAVNKALGLAAPEKKQAG